MTRGPTWLDERRDPEVHELDVVVAGPVHHEDVLRLDVAVHDAVRVAVQQRLHQRAAQAGAVALGQGAAVDDAVEQVATLAQLHHEVHVLQIGVEGDRERG